MIFCFLRRHKNKLIILIFCSLTAITSYYFIFNSNRLLHTQFQKVKKGDDIKIVRNLMGKEFNKIQNASSFSLVWSEDLYEFKFSYPYWVRTSTQIYKIEFYGNIVIKKEQTDDLADLFDL